MDKSKQAFREGFNNGWRLFWAPFVGALDEMTAAINRPKSTSCKEFMRDSVRAYFAPLTGAVRGFRKALNEIEK